jgi:hypothetical protein
MPPIKRTTLVARNYPPHSYVQSSNVDHERPTLGGTISVFNNETLDAVGAVVGRVLFFCELSCLNRHFVETATQFSSGFSCWSHVHDLPIDLIWPSYIGFCNNVKDEPLVRGVGSLLENSVGRKPRLSETADPIHTLPNVTFGQAKGLR